MISSGILITRGEACLSLDLVLPWSINSAGLGWALPVGDDCSAFGL